MSMNLLSGDLQTIVDHTLEALLLADLDGTLRAFNRKAENYIFQNSERQLMKGASLYQYLPPERVADFRSLIARVAQGEIIQYERHYPHPGARDTWFAFSLTPVFTGAVVTGLCIQGRDITAVKEAENLSLSLFNEGPVPMFVCARQSLQYLDVNAAALALYGYSRSEILAMSPFDIRVPEQHKELHDIVANGPQNWDSTRIGRHRKKNGELLTVQVATHQIHYQGQEATLIVISDVTQILLLEQALDKEKLDRQRIITQATIQAQEKERLSIGRELHDNVNQMLASAKMFISYAALYPEEAPTVLEKCGNTLDNAIQEIRSLSHRLVPPALSDLGLSQAIRQLAKGMGFDRGVFSHAGLSVLARLPASAAFNTCIYRIVQEHLSNIVKHARASRVHLQFRYKGGQLSLRLSDNGQGFDTMKTRNGIGLSNIADRASSFNGRSAVHSSPGQGTTLSVVFDLTTQTNG